MPPRRHSNPTAFWANASVGVGGLSDPVTVGHGEESLIVLITVSTATTVSLQAALNPPVDATGIFPDFDPDDAVWGQVYYLDTPIQVVFTTSASASVIVPDFAPEWIRLKSSAAATITAGYEISTA